MDDNNKTPSENSVDNNTNNNNSNNNSNNTPNDNINNTSSGENAMKALDNNDHPGATNASEVVSELKNSKFAEGLGKAQDVLGTIQEIGAAKDRIDADRENGDSSLEAYAKEGGRQAKDYGERKAKEALRKEYEKRKAAKEAAKKKAQEEAEKQGAETSAKEGGKEGGKEAAEEAAEEAAKKKAEEEAAKKAAEEAARKKAEEEAAKRAAEKAGEEAAKKTAEGATTTAGTTGAGTTAAGTTAAGTTAAGTAAGAGAGAGAGAAAGEGVAASGPYGWLIAAIIIVVIVIIIILYLTFVFMLLSGLDEMSLSNNPTYYNCKDELMIYDDSKSVPVTFDDYLTYKVYNIFLEKEFNDDGSVSKYSSLVFRDDVLRAAIIAERSRIIGETTSDCSIQDNAYDKDEVSNIISRANPDLARYINKLNTIIESTKDQIITGSEGLPLLGKLSYFCLINIDDSYYTLYQKDQLILKDWVNQRYDMKNEWKITMCDDKYDGISLYGAEYLSETMNYNAEKIIKYYYGDDVSISTVESFGTAGDATIKITKDASNKISTPIDSYLRSKGSSLNQLNNYISSNVDSAGYGTRQGVVAAAVSLITYLYDNFDAKLPYYWGGKYAGKGIPTTFGEYHSPPSISRNGNPYYVKSFDCSGFVQWAIINGGFKNPGTGTGYFAQIFGSNSCDISQINCVGIPGDLINSANGHVQLIVSVDNKADKYMVAESTTIGVVIQLRGMHQNNSEGTYRILHMDNFYRNSALN